MDYDLILKQMQDYYSNLLIIQYNGKKKAKATIELMARLIWSNMALIQIRDAFDWKTADSNYPSSTEGAQLDIIGKWVGISRAYNENNTWSNTYLSYPSYGTETIAETDPQRGGYSDYSTFDTLEGGVLTYKDLQANTQQLTNEEYRTVIGLKIIKNSIIHNQGNIDEAVARYFSTPLYTKGYDSYDPTNVFSQLRVYTDPSCKFEFFGNLRGGGSNPYLGESGYFNFYATNSTQILHSGYVMPIEQIGLKLWQINYVNVYTTWQHGILTYHHPASLTTIMNICLNKNVLPVPTGVEIQLASY